MVDLVIARFNEDLFWLDQTKVDRIFIYDKGNIEISPEILEKDNVVYKRLRNWGRESDTYLNHIIDYYHDFSDVVIFAQGFPFDHCNHFLHAISQPTIEKMIEVSKRYYDEDTPMHFTDQLLSLGNTWLITSEGLAHWDRFLWYNSLMKVFDVLYGVEAIPFPAIATWGAQFAIKSSCIKKYTLDQYKKLLSISNKNYYLPWGFEKYWLFFYEYSKEELFKRQLVRCEYY